MPYTDQQIRDYALQLEQKGAPVEKIREFVSAAAKDRVPAPQVSPPAQEAAPIPRRGGPTMEMLASSVGGPIMADDNGQAAGLVTDIALQGGGPAAGQALGAMTGPFAPAAVPILGAVGGAAGDAISQFRRMASGNQNKFQYGEMMGAGLTGAIPGASLAKSGLGKVALTGLGYGAGNLAAGEIQSLQDKQKPLSGSEGAMAFASGAISAPLSRVLSFGKTIGADEAAIINNYSRDRTYRNAVDNGYLILPSKMNPEAANMLEWAGGKASMKQAVGLRDQVNTNRLAKQGIGIAPNAPLTSEAISAARKSNYEPYEKISELFDTAQKDLAALKKGSFTSGDYHDLQVQMDNPLTVEKIKKLETLGGADIQLLKETRFKAKDEWQALAMGDPAARERAVALTNKAEAIENNIEEAAKIIGDNTLLDRLKDARRKLAKIEAVDSAFNPDSGNVNAQALGLIRKNHPDLLTDELRSIASFANAFPDHAIPAERIMAPGSGQMGAFAAASGASDVATGNAGGLFKMGVPLAGKPAREAVLSPRLNRWLSAPNYRNAPPNFAQNFARFATQSAGRDNPFLQPTQ